MSKYIKSIVLFCLCSTITSAQIELNSTYSFHGKGNLNGLGVNLAYEFPIKGKLFTKTQFASKYLRGKNNFIGASTKGNIYEIHQTFSIPLLNNPKFSIIPNIGINYRVFNYQLQISEPLRQGGFRAWVMGFRNGFLSADSYEKPFDTHYEDNIGYTFQLQGRFVISSYLSFLVTGFVEDDYDRIQTIGGLSFGLRYNWR